MRTPATALTLVSLAASGLLLAGCGGETVDSSDVTKSSAPTTSSSSQPSASSSVSTTATSTATVTSTTGAPSGAPAPEAEQPAREIESAPAQGSTYSAAEQAFLDGIRNEGINVDGVEDQLTATGRSVCDGTTFTRDAVAGQLVEQRRTTLDPAAAAQLIDETAHADLC